MSERILKDAYNIKKLVREAEALADESMLSFAKLKAAVLAARQNPEVGVDAGQRVLMRLTQAEQHAMNVSTNLLRVHDELSKEARVYAGSDDGVPTDIEPSKFAIEGSPKAEIA
jgi:hypothetical protein